MQPQRLPIDSAEASCDALQPKRNSEGKYEAIDKGHLQSPDSTSRFTLARYSQVLLRVLLTPDEKARYIPIERRDGGGAEQLTRISLSWCGSNAPRLLITQCCQEVLQNHPLKNYGVPVHERVQFLVASLKVSNSQGL